MSTFEDLSHPDDPGAILALWEKLRDASEIDKADIFDKIFRSIERYARGYLRARIQDPNVADELLSDVRYRLWKASRSFAPVSRAAFLAYIKTICHSSISNYFLDPNNDPRRCELPEDLSDQFIPDSDLIRIEVFLEWATNREILHRLMNELWLGTNCDKSQLLGLQLKFEHGKDAELVAQLIESSALLHGEDPFAGISKDTVRWFAYQKLYLDGDCLASELISPNKPLSPSTIEEINAKARTASGNIPSCRWTWEEVRVLLWRVRNGLLTSQILEFRTCPFEKDALKSFDRRIVSLFPHKGVMAKLLQVCRDLSHKPEVLADDGLWRRLAFEYRLLDSLSHQDIQDRIDPPARLVRKPIPLSTLNGWLSADRLLDQLIDYAEEQYAA